MNGTPPDGDFARLIEDLGRESARRLREASTQTEYALGHSVSHRPEDPHLFSSNVDVHSAGWGQTQHGMNEPGRVVRTTSAHQDWEVLVQAFEPAKGWLKGVVLGLIILIVVGSFLPLIQTIGFPIWLVYTLFGIVRFKIPRDAAMHFFHRALDRTTVQK